MNPNPIATGASTAANVASDPAWSALGAKVIAFIVVIVGFIVAMKGVLALARDDEKVDPKHHINRWTAHGSNLLMVALGAGIGGGAIIGLMVSGGNWFFG